MLSIRGWILASAVLGGAVPALEAQEPNVVASRKLIVKLLDHSVGPETAHRLLWVTTDEAATWNRTGTPEATVSLTEITEKDGQVRAHVVVPQDGRYGFAWQVGPTETELSAPPVPGRWPEGVLRVIVDTTAPTVKAWADPDHPGRIRFEAVDALSPIPGLSLWMRRGTGEWAELGETAIGRDEKGTYFTADVTGDGPVEFAVQATDAAGKASDREAASSRVRLSAARPLPAKAEAPRLLIPAGGETWTAGHSVLLKWLTPGGAGMPVRLEWRAGPEADWQAIASGREATGFCFWVVPDGPTDRAQIRVAGDTLVSEPGAPFTIRAAGRSDIAAALKELESARGRMAQQKTAESVVHLEQALEHWHDCAEALSLLGIAYASMGERETALRYALDAVRAESSNASYHHNAAHAMVELGLLEPSLIHLGHAVRLAKRGERRLPVRLGETLLIAARKLLESDKAAEAAVAAGWVHWVPGATDFHRQAADELLAGIKKP